MRKIYVLFPVILVFIGLLVISTFSPMSGSTSVVPKTLQPKTGGMKVDLNFGKFPLYFITNNGQVNKKAAFYAKASRYTLWLTREGLVFDGVIRGKDSGVRGKAERNTPPSGQSLPLTPYPLPLSRDVSRLLFMDADKNPEIIPVEPAKLKVNYFIGNDKSKWYGNVPTSMAVLYKNIYKNIDLKVYGIEKQIEYDWMVKPGGNPEDIRFEYKNVKATRIDEEGNLVVGTEFGELIHKRPVSYQVIRKTQRKTVSAAFKKIGKNTYGFEVGNYDKNIELIIDPVVLAYSTYLGGGDTDGGNGIALDNNGYVYVAGYTASTDFPTLDQYQSNAPNGDAFVMKIDPTQSGASSLIYSTYLGGSASDIGSDIAVDGNGYVYVSGYTSGWGFPTLNQYQSGFQGGYMDVFVAKLDPSQSGVSGLLYSTYLGGDSDEYCYGIAADNNGYAYVTGPTISSNFPVHNEFQTTTGTVDAFVTKIDTTQSGASSLAYSTYLGGTSYDYGEGIAVDGSEIVYVTGYTAGWNFPLLNALQTGFPQGFEAFVTKLDTTQTGVPSLLYSTLLGGSENDYGEAIAVSDGGIVYAVGSTQSPNFPTLNEYQGDQELGDAFITKLDTTQSGVSSLLYSTYLGGSGSDAGFGIAVSDGEVVYVTGATLSTDFPLLNEYQGYQDAIDAYITKLDTTQSGVSGLIYSTYLGGSLDDRGFDVAADDNGNVFVIGDSESSDFPTQDQYQTDQTGDDAFMAKLSFPIPPTSYTLESPNGGENWQVNSLHNITWTSIGVGDYVKIEYSTDNGGDWTGITASTENDGTYPWTVPDAVSADCLIRVSETDGDPSDTSDNVFSIIPIPTIDVTAPNGGETWQVVSTQNITWTGTGTIENVKIEYSADNGDNWTEITASTENDGSHFWTLPYMVSTQCLVRVGDTGGSPVDNSDSVFSITVPATWIPETERNILIALYNATGGDNWTDNSGWKAPPLYTDGFAMPGTETNWHGITVSDVSGYHVTQVLLGSNNLNGGIPAELGNLSKLERLYLYNNQLAGSIPAELGNLTNVIEIQMYSNQLNGSIPTAIGNLVNLKILALGSNQLTGSLPVELGNLSSLESLALYNNQLTGGLPSTLGNLSNLNHFAISRNDLDGAIPPELGNLNNMGYLDLRENQFTGSIPPSLGNLDNLRHLYLQYNDLDGPIPPEMGNISSLQYLDLSGNLLNGTIPTQLENLGDLKSLKLNFNQLTGDIPPELGNIFNLETLDLNLNQLTGNIPGQLANLGNVKTIRIAFNQLTGNIPPQLGDLNSLEQLTLNNNQLTGSIPPQLGNLGNLRSLFLQGNQLDGDIPPELGNMHSLVSLLLNNNRITGSIPAEIGNLINLGSLLLDSNQLTGTIPTEIGNLVNLTSLQLQSNQLTGGIPSSLSNLINLSSSYTNIGYNALYTDDDNLQTFLNSKDADWETTQTIAPTGISAVVGSTDDSMEITWTPITYTANTGGYRVFYGTGPGGPYTLFDTTANKTIDSMTVTGLTLGETYYFMIRTRTEPHGDNSNTVDSDPSEEISAAAGPSITVTSPNGGENLDAGSVHEITWTSEGEISNVMIEYSTDNGNSWQTIVQATENDGIYNWNVPTAASDNCLVRVMANDEDGGPADTSDAVFSIVSAVPGSITIRSPNGGENWTVGTSQEIKWNSTGDISYVAIEYSRDNGTTWNKITQSTTNDGSYNWKTPNTASDKCLVRVTANDGDRDPIPSDAGDAVFSILRPTSPTLEVTTPNGGEQLVVGARYAVTWYTTNSRGDAVLEYSVDNGDSWTEIAGVTENDGEYDWTVPDTPSETCLVRISETGGDPSDVSDTVFSIVSPLPSDIVVTAPNGGENWEAGSSQEITWTAAGDINNVSIELSTDNGTTWENIVQTTANDGSFDWTVPDTASETCRVRVTDNETNMDPKPSDVSDFVFSIDFPSTPTIRVTAPNGGEQLVVGSRFAITWFATDSRAEAKIEYSTDGGDNWTDITGATPNDGEYDWTVPDDPSETCLVRISETGGQPLDISDAVFSIVPPLSTDITVTAPNGGESRTAGTSGEITWTCTGDINNVTIEYSTDNGTTWRIITQTTANDGSYDWTVPETVSDECLVRITSNDSNQDPRPSDVSDGVFSIVSFLPGDFRLTSPNGGESWEMGSTHAVTWSTNGDIGDVMLEYSTDDGVSWSTIVSNTTNSGTYDWLIPDNVSETCRVRVTANDGGGDPRPSDESDSVFSIVFPSSPTIRVITPNGGEELLVGSTYEITWFATDSRAEAKIDYSMDGGQNWIEITGAAPNNGSYDWPVPHEPSETCLIRVGEINGQPVDISDAVFSIVSAQTGDLTVLTPNGGESMETASEYSITWDCADLNNVFIEYSVNNGSTWVYIDTASAGEGSYTWTVPGTPSDNCRIRISGADSDENPSDISDGVFSITDPSQNTVEVFTPNGGDSLSVGGEYYITWGSSGLNNVVIEYSVDNGETWEYIVSAPATGGRYTWMVPDTPSDSCLIRISGDDSPNDPSDVSDTVFSIVSN